MDGKSWLLGARADGSMTVEEPRAGSLRRVFSGPGGAREAAISADGLRVAFVFADRVAIFDAASGSETATLRKLSARPVTLSFDPAGESLFIGGADGRVYHWRFEFERGAVSLRERERVLERYFGHSAIVSAVVSHPMGRVFFSGDWSGRVNAWLAYEADRFEGEYDTTAVRGRAFTAEVTRVRNTGTIEGSIEQLRVSDDGEYLLVSTDTGRLQLWSVRGFARLADVAAHQGLIYDAVLAGDGRSAATVGRDGAVRRWRIDVKSRGEATPTEALMEKSGEWIDSTVRFLALGADGALFGVPERGRAIEFSESVHEQ